MNVLVKIGDSISNGSARLPQFVMNDDDNDDASDHISVNSGVNIITGIQYSIVNGYGKR